MPTLKKLIFAPLFLIAFALLISQLSPIFKSADFIFSLSLETFLQLLFVSGLILLSSLFFVLFVSLAQDWKLVLPVAILAAIFPVIFLEPSIAIILVVAVLVSFLISFLALENTLKTYLTFQPNSIFGPSIRHLSSLLILVIAMTYFLAISKVITQNGFQIPDSLIDTALKAIPQPQDITAPQDLTSDILKQTIKDQFQALLKPYSSFIPAILALLLFFTLQSLVSVINIFIYPLLWLVFYILEKTGFIKFTTEMRPVKKMVI